MPTLGLVHNSPMLAGVFNEIAARVMPDVRILHFVDESTIKNTIAAGHLQKSTMRQVIRLVGSTFDAGCDVAMVTCSSIGRAVEMAAELYDQPVLRVDRAMAEQAVASATRIGVVATLSTTLDPTADLVRRVAAEQGKAIELVAHLCEGAFDAVMVGDGATHDRIVGEALTTALADVDAIVLAQASMARVVAALPEGAVKVPVLASPELGMLRAAEVLKGLSK
ncbi:Asp/Glu/hydantoin racemase [Sphingomonas koreensis]|jgi:Asp/Glu/hydantoin racemase|uniref:Asp/Glu/hydantoin racemase n=1 Tax=Sphingomonas koreensis TaxID=93064 RepID=A0A1L6J608_9SPHN|nr:aspartate/glutamate racemase family protein [Sphingomonas koreensis]APR51277.1 Asp/Glu/hydantoin racemase [Sphingomonas koreensis]MDC7810391.1 aspartate/glutamate racemase family protein [Sphingomonas koreensis]RSU17565.1 Asp/Glu/hydantoin racemase [Sphingomonas koreensis]RSU21821.1 Asp/Glu/hydantoin racemase [Sphingomonas koreensis]RSU26188.1 Asp/Glu/hydantoin racemase [Sphingomonas koreensis]